MCLFKIKDGDCIGGFTKAQWQSLTEDQDDYYIGDNDAMLFNLTQSRHFPSLKTGIDIICDS